MLYMWCNSLGDTNGNPKLGFNAARSILCGATPVGVYSFGAFGVSMPHAAFYVVQQYTIFDSVPLISFNAARSILCGATI